MASAWGTGGYVEHRAGDLPVIVGVPHGGALRPPEISDRTHPRSADAMTLELAGAVADALVERLGRRPHLVICHLHRAKVDVNRPLAGGAEGDPGAARAWREYHGLIDAAAAAVTTRHEGGLFIDLHGLAARRSALEWGYLLNGAALLEDDAQLARAPYAQRSSLRTLAGRTRASFPQLVRGPDSLGGLLEAAGFAGVPSPGRPDPGRNPDGTPGRFYRGGYGTRRHGSLRGGPIDAVQLETNWAGVRDGPGSRAAFAAAFAGALERYFAVHYGVRLRVTGEP